MKIRTITALLAITIMASLAIQAQAQTAWVGTGSGDVFTETANWDNGLPTLANPGTMGNADFVWSTTAGDMSSIDLTITGLANWTSSEGLNNNNISNSIITITGSSASMTTDRGVVLTNSTWSVLGDAGLDFNRDFRMEADSATLMNSPNTFRARSLSLSGDAVFTLADGTLYLDNTDSKWGLIGSDSAYLDITSNSALFKRAGDFVTVIEGQITSGFIRTNGAPAAASAFSVSFDGTDTVVFIVPDETPATVSLDPTSTVYLGEAFTLTADVSGSAPIEYQWYQGGSVLSGETNATYLSTNAQYADAGQWSIMVSNAFGSDLAVTEVVVVDSPAIVYWDNGSADGLVDTVSNWNPAFLPSFSLGVLGVVADLGGGTIVKVAAGDSLSDTDITFEDGTTLTDAGENSLMETGSLVFNGSSWLDFNGQNFEMLSGSSLVLSNTIVNLAKLVELSGDNNVMTVANSASLEVKRSWRLDTSSANNTLNWFSTGTLSTGMDAGHVGTDGVLLDHSSDNVINISAGKISGDENGIIVTLGNYINFTADSTGVLEARGVDFSVEFTDYVTNGLIRIDDVITTNLVSFVINYDGADTTMFLSGVFPVSDIEFTDVGYVAVSNGVVLGWTAVPADAGLDVYRTPDLVIPSWSKIATNVVGSFTDTAITTQAFYQLVPAGETYP